MSNAIDLNAILRDACTLALSQHIQARLAQTGCKLLRGSPEGHAKFIISRWTDTNVRVFYLLAKESSSFWSHARLAKETGSTAKSTRDFWSRTLKKSKIAARPADTVERQELRLFRRGHEMFFSSFGIKLQIRASMLAFDLARTVTNTTMGQTVALRQNYEGACASQEADVSKTQEERAGARDRLNDEMTRPEVLTAQERLFG